MFSFNRIIEIRNGKDSLSHLVLAPCQTDIVPLGLWAPTASRHSCNEAQSPALDKNPTSSQFLQPVRYSTPLVLL